jgi:hypothetical protein
VEKVILRAAARYSPKAPVSARTAPAASEAASGSSARFARGTLHVGVLSLFQQSDQLIQSALESRNFSFEVL